MSAFLGKYNNKKCRFQITHFKNFQYQDIKLFVNEVGIKFQNVYFTNVTTPNIGIKIFTSVKLFVLEKNYIIIVELIIF